METTSSSPITESLPNSGTIDRAAQTAHQAIDRVVAKAGPAVERVRSMASSAATRLQSQADTLADIEDRWLESTRTYVRENPLTAVGIGLVAGLLLGRLSR